MQTCSKQNRKMFRTCLKNRVLQREKDYRCYLCHCEIPDTDFKAVQEHFNDWRHKWCIRKFGLTELDAISSISETQCKTIVENQIATTDKKHNYRCYLCKCYISSLPDVFTHIEASSHQSSFEKKFKGALTMKQNDSKLQEVLKNKPAQPVLEQHDSHLGEVENESVQSFFKQDDLNHQEVNSQMTRLILKPNQSNFQGIKSGQIKLVQNNMIQKVKISKKNMLKYLDMTYYCSHCEVNLTSAALVKYHCMLHLFQIHDLKQDDIIHFDFTNDNVTVIKCLACDVTMNTVECLVDHLRSEKHKSFMNRISSLKVKDNQQHKSATKNPFSQFSQFELLDSIILVKNVYCELCNVTMTKADSEQHLDSIEHYENLLNVGTIKKGKLKVKYRSKNQTVDKMDGNEKIYMCFICNKTYQNVTPLLMHYSNNIHQSKMDYFCKILNEEEIKPIRVVNSTTDGIPNQINKDTEKVINKSQSEINRHQTIKKSSENLASEQTYGWTSLFTMSSMKTVGDFLKTKLLGNTTSEASSSTTGIPNQINIHNRQEINKEPRRIEKLQLPSENSIPQKFDESTSAVTNPLVELNESVNRLEITSDYLLTDKSYECPSSIPTAFDELNELIPLDLSKEQKNTLLKSRNRKPRRPNTDKSKSHFGKNLPDFAETYIEMCIEPGSNNIYNVREETIRLLKLGMQLIFATDSKRICIPCGCEINNGEFFLYEHLQDLQHINALRSKEIDDQQYSSLQDQFSDLRLAKAYMKKQLDDFVHCYACNSQVRHVDKKIGDHIASKEHTLVSEDWKCKSTEISEKLIATFMNFWYYAHFFTCKPCNARCDLELDFIVHLNSQQHMKELKKAKHKNTDMKCVVCPVCITCWYGPLDTYTKHCEDGFHKRFLINKEFMVPNMSAPTKKLLIEANETIHRLVSQSDKTTDLEQEKERTLLQSIEETVESVYPAAKSYAFGSRISYLGFPDSDVDVFLDCENVYYNVGSKERSERYLQSVKSLFTSQYNTWIVDEILLRTRIPILKLRHLETNLKCDISFTNGLSIEKSTLIKYFNVAFSICRQLILYLKKWLAYCRLSGSDGITTYAVSWFVVFYLQTERILPSVYLILESGNRSKIVDGWECGFAEIIPVAETNLTFKDFLQGFFTYYAAFDFHQNVICPFMGKIMSKRTFANAADLPEEMNSYKNRLARDDLEYFRLDSPMCIQDPVDLSQNMTKAVTKFQLRCFVQYCAESAAIIADG